MAQAAVKIFENAPDERADNTAIDRSHLSRMTFGDQSLEREVLQLFDRQAELLMERMTHERAGRDCDIGAHVEGVGRRHRRRPRRPRRRRHGTGREPRPGRMRPGNRRARAIG